MHRASLRQLKICKACLSFPCGVIIQAPGGSSCFRMPFAYTSATLFPVGSVCDWEQPDSVAGFARTSTCTPSGARLLLQKKRNSKKMSP